MTRRLPDAALTVVTSFLLKRGREAAREVIVREIREPPARELAKIGQGSLQKLCLKALVKDDRVQVRRHDHVSVDAQALVAMAEVEAVGDDFAGGFGDKMGSQSTIVNVT